MFQKRNGSRHFKVFLEIGLTLKMGKIVEKYLERHPFSIKLQAISLQIEIFQRYFSRILLKLKLVSHYSSKYFKIFLRAGISQ